MRTPISFRNLASSLLWLLRLRPDAIFRKRRSLLRRSTRCEPSAVAVHDRSRPHPKVVETAGAVTTPPPSDAVVIFNGTDLSGWKLDKPKDGKEWVGDGSMERVPGSGYIKTKEQFGDCQLRIEWAAPAEVRGDGQGRGNSGVFLMGRTEI